MNIRQSESYRRPRGVRYSVGSTLAPMCKSRYPIYFPAVYVKSTRTVVDQAFSVPKCVILARMSENILRVTVQKVLSSSGENQRGIRIDTGKEVHEIRQWELQ